MSKTKLGYFVRITGVLLLVCTVIAALLAAVNAVTKDQIDSYETAKKEESMKYFFAEMTEYAEETVTVKNVNAVYTVKGADGTVLGYCIDLYGTGGYGGNVELIVGISAAGEYKGAKVLVNSETFIDKYTDGEGYYNGVDKVAGATKSYDAIQNGIALAKEVYAAISGSDPAGKGE